LYGALIALWGCAPALGTPEVSYGEARPLPLVQPSTDGRRWYLPMETSALGPVVWFVDTGYTYSTCDDGLVSSLGLTPRGRVRIRGELGRVKASKATLPAMALGGHTVSGVVCQVRDLATTSSLDDPEEVPIAGVIGMDVLRQFRVIFDPAEGTLELLDPAAREPLPRAGEGISRLRRAGLLGLRARLSLEVGSDDLWPILDTGATNTYLDGTRIGLVPSYTLENVVVRGTGQGGAEMRRLHSYEVVQVTVGGVPAGPATLIDRHRRWWEPGLLGLDLLTRFHQDYDFASGRARLTPTTATRLPRFSSYWPSREELPSRLLDEPSDAASEP
jgi:predicted aspartyl protease